MIRIDRSRARAPRKLLQDGKAHLESTIEALAVSMGLHSTDFDRAIYASDEVRERLWKMQHYEVKHSTVEHFRPKTNASDDTRNRGTKRPGYWWLAYTFENLYFCCKNCNTPKSTFFPLMAGFMPLAPKTLPSGTNENALLLDPGVDDPEPHIKWLWSSRRRGYIPVGATDRGKETIRATEIDQRDALSQLRAQYYRSRIRPLLIAHREARRSNDPDQLVPIHRDAELIARPEAQFSALARFLFHREGIL